MRAGEDEREAVGRKGHAYLTTGRVGMGSKSAGELAPGYSGVAGGLPLGAAVALTAPSALGQLSTAPAVPLFLDPAQFFPKTTGVSPSLPPSHGALGGPKGAGGGERAP